MKIQPARLMAAVLGCSVAGLLGACATTTTASAPQGPANTVAKASAEDRETITGSRIPAKTTERLVQQVGTQELETYRPPSPGPRIN